MSKNTAVVQRVSAVQAQSFSGPLPHPNDFSGYEQTLPGAANRILAMAEDQLKFRHESEMAARSETKRGQLLSAGLTMLAFVSAIVCAALHEPAVGCIIAGTTLIGVVSAIMKNRAK